MRVATSAMILVAAVSAAPALAQHHDHALAEGRLVVETMLAAVATQDQGVFGRVVDRDAAVVIGQESTPATLKLPPVALGCADPKITKVEPSDNVVGDSKVTVAWTCTQRLPEFDGKLAIRFWVHGGKVIFGERV